MRDAGERAIVLLYYDTHANVIITHMDIHRLCMSDLTTHYHITKDQHKLGVCVCVCVCACLCGL